MSNSSPPEPPSPLNIDEWMAIFVAFTAISSIGYWVQNKQDQGWTLKNLQFLPPSPQPNQTPEALSTPKPTPTAPESSPVISNPIPTAPKSPSPRSPTLAIPRLSKLLTRKKKPSPTPPTSSVEFSDVPNNFWANPAIASLAKRNVVVGFPDGTFEPERFATRGELAAMLQKAFDRKNKQNPVDFEDLPPNYWASDAIAEVFQTGILKGYSDNRFRPNQPVSRAEVLVALVTALNLKPPSTPEKSLQSFKDGEQVPDYAIAKIAAAKAAGLVTGYRNGELLVPSKPATRAEVAAMIYQALQQ
ncbi:MULTISPECIES: S-layer homology domain-containing protein [unclassified Coleofasciculus]|uniref:S-layer homology domain-containing protein n=1 Tax=unclassified Coleofasciculus TaxID=2692782 RepID=UPI001881599F|nr:MULTISPECIES: S-layer homology domain-containing protein [unclassified Coleofasciculus]MBE9125932.1 S-layer homology domain-containing protein [Coleofasciculus sp. LEGE 07081]MBE9149303.1 S-layer homology domain-containing protein [Coleofasciculus sp. LEGE 07092]